DGGPATSATIGPKGIAVDGLGDLYIADGSKIRMVDTSGIITTIAGSDTPSFAGDGGLATAARLFGPDDVVVDGLGNIFIADTLNNRVRRVDTQGIITTVAGGLGGLFGGDGGPATSAALYNPTSVALDAIGNLYIADKLNHRIRRVDTSGVITTFAGNGTT